MQKMYGMILIFLTFGQYLFGDCTFCVITLPLGLVLLLSKREWIY